MEKKKNINWNVCYGKGYWGKSDEKPETQEVVVDCNFVWQEESWYIPAAYLFEEGLVIDYCVKVDPAKVKAWIDQWQIGSLNEHELTHEQWAEMEQTNPLNIKFNSTLKCNGEVLQPQMGSSISWIPPELLTGDVENAEEAAQVLQCYDLDENKAWSFHRCSYPWREAKQTPIHSLKLKSECGLKEIQGIHFGYPGVGDEISFVHPVSGVNHILTVLAYEQKEISLRESMEEEYEFPKYHTAMTYTLEPDLSECNFQIKDCLQNDEPKLRGKTSDCADSIGIIGGADGPTALAFAKEGDAKIHMAFSALHFEWTEQVEWKMVFRVKQMKDIEVKLI